MEYDSLNFMQLFLVLFILPKRKDYNFMRKNRFLYIFFWILVLLLTPLIFFDFSYQVEYEYLLKFLIASTALIIILKELKTKKTDPFLKKDQFF